MTFFCSFFFFWTTGCLGLLIYGPKYYRNTYCLIQEIWNISLAKQRTEGKETPPHTEKLYFQKVSSFFYLKQFVFLLTPQTRPEIHEHAQQRYEGEALSPQTCRVINLKVSIRGPAMCCALLAPRRRRGACGCMCGIRRWQSLHTWHVHSRSSTSFIKLLSRSMLPGRSEHLRPRQTLTWKIFFLKDFYFKNDFYFFFLVRGCFFWLQRQCTRRPGHWNKNIFRIIIPRFYLS